MRFMKKSCPGSHFSNSWHSAGTIGHNKMMTEYQTSHRSATDSIQSVSPSVLRGRNDLKRERPWRGARVLPRQKGRWCGTGCLFTLPDLVRCPASNSRGHRQETASSPMRATRQGTMARVASQPATARPPVRSYTHGTRAEKRQSMCKKERERKERRK